MLVATICLEVQHDGRHGVEADMTAQSCESHGYDDSHTDKRLGRTVTRTYKRKKGGAVV